MSLKDELLGTMGIHIQVLGYLSSPAAHELQDKISALLMKECELKKEDISFCTAVGISLFYKNEEGILKEYIAHPEEVTDWLFKKNTID